MNSYLSGARMGELLPPVSVSYENEMGHRDDLLQSKSSSFGAPDGEPNEMDDFGSHISFAAASTLSPATYSRPEVSSVTAPDIYSNSSFSFQIYNLPFDTTVMDLVTMFKPYGSIIRVYFNPSLRSGHIVCSGSGNVVLKTSSQMCDKVMYELNGMALYPGSSPLTLAVSYRLFCRKPLIYTIHDTLQVVRNE